MQCTVSVGLWCAEPVASALGVQAVQVGDFGIYVPADFFLVGLVWAVKHDSGGIQVIYFFKRNMFRFHFVPYGVYRFYTSLERVFQPHCVETFLDGCREFVENFISMSFGSGDFFAYGFISLRMFIFEAQVFKFGFYCKQAETVSQRSIYVKGFTCNLVLLAREHGAERAHVVKAVGHLD